MGSLYAGHCRSHGIYGRRHLRNQPDVDGLCPDPGGGLLHESGCLLWRRRDYLRQLAGADGIHSRQPRSERRGGGYCTAGCGQVEKICGCLVLGRKPQVKQLFKKDVLQFRNCRASFLAVMAVSAPAIRMRVRQGIRSLRRGAGRCGYDF